MNQQEVIISQLKRELKFKPSSDDRLLNISSYIGNRMDINVGTGICRLTKTKGNKILISKLQNINLCRQVNLNHFNGNSKSTVSIVKTIFNMKNIDK